MEEYAGYYSAACLIMAAYVMVKGVLAALAQRKDPEFSTLFPPPAYGVVASVLLTFGLGFLKLKLPWWGYRLIFPGTTLLLPAIIYLIGRRPSPK